MPESQDEEAIEFRIYDDTAASHHDFDNLDLHFHDPTDENTRLVYDLEEYLKNGSDSDIDNLSEDIPDEHSDTGKLKFLII